MRYLVTLSLLLLSVYTFGQSKSDCEGAIPLCNDFTSVGANEFNGTGNINDENASSCWDGTGSGGTVWYTFSPETAGKMGFELSPSGGTDYDIVLFDATNGCNNLQELSCNFSLEAGSTGLTTNSSIYESSYSFFDYEDCTGSQYDSGNEDCGRWNESETVDPSKTYVLLVNYYGGTNDGFTIDFQNNSNQVHIGDQTPPTVTNISTPSCGDNTFTVNFSEGIDCNSIQNGDFTLSGPNGPYTITNIDLSSCNNGYTNTATITVTPSISTTGSYTLNTVNITDACGNNLDTPGVDFTFNITSTVTAAITGNLTICKGKSTTLTATGGGTYKWTPNGETTAAITVSPPVTTNYTVDVSNSCSATDQASVTVTVIPPSSPSVTGKLTICEGETTIITATGIGPFEWKEDKGIILGWQNIGSGSTITLNPTSTTRYQLTDSSPCGETIPFTLTVNKAFDASFTVTDFCKEATNTTTITGDTDGEFTFNPTPTDGATVNINTGEISNATGETTYTIEYTVGITPCKASTTQQVTAKTCCTLTLSKLKTDVNCYGDSSGTAKISTNNGITPITYAWSNGDSTDSIGGLNAGSLSVTVTDASGCALTETLTIDEPDELKTSLNSTNPTCFDSNDGSATVVPSGGTAPYSYSWTDGQITATATNLPAGTHTVTVTDRNECTSTETTTLTEPTEILASISAFAQATCGQENGSATVSVTGGVTPVSYSWNDGQVQTTATASNLGAGTYTATITDANGCTGTASVTILIGSVPSVDFTSSDTVGCGETCITFSNNSINGIDYAWDFGDGNSSSNETPIHCYTTEGSYDITLFVTDTAGCKTSLTKTDYINIYAIPIANFTATPTSISIRNPTISFYDQSSGAKKWNWNFGDSIGISSDQNPNYTYNEVGEFCATLYVENNLDCSDSTSVCIIITPEFAFYAPNAFTPNDDGDNDIWLPNGVGINESTYELMIFNRWGELIFTTDIWGRGWDGTRNNGGEQTGVTSQIDVYVWIIQFKDNITDRNHSYTGHISLIR